MLKNLFFKKPSMNAVVLFHTDANPWGSHGEIIVSHVDKGLDKKAIRFVFRGMERCPPLTPDVVAYLFNRAEAEGYIVFELVRYNSVMQQNLPAPKLAPANIDNKSIPIYNPDNLSLETCFVVNESSGTVVNPMMMRPGDNEGRLRMVKPEDVLNGLWKYANKELT